MSEICALCGAIDNLQTHHWLYGDKEVEEKWAITVCVGCHQKIHQGHGVGHGSGYKLRSTPEIALKFFKTILENPKISTSKLAKEVCISEPTIRKMRKSVNLHKRRLSQMDRNEVVKAVVWQMYIVLEGGKNVELEGSKEVKRKMCKRSFKWIVIDSLVKFLGKVRAIGTVKISRGGKVQITKKALEKLGWIPGETLVEMLNDDDDAHVLMRERDVNVEMRESRE